MIFARLGTSLLSSYPGMWSLLESGNSFSSARFCCSGMAPLIRAVLSKLIGDEEAAKIEIIANDVEVREDGSWEIKYRHPSSGFGHDKSQAILPYRALPNPPTTFFFGDGVSGQLRFTSMLNGPSRFIPCFA